MGVCLSGGGGGDVDFGVTGDFAVVLPRVAEGLGGDFGPPLTRGRASATSGLVCLVASFCFGLEAFFKD